MIALGWLLACSSGGGGPCAEPEGCLLGEGLPAGLLSVHAPADDEIWITGASPGDGTGPVVLQGTSEGWERHGTSTWAGSEVWWAWVHPDEVVLVGNDGLLLELDRASGTIAAIDDVPEQTTFFGVWGASPDDVWAVGQTDSGQGPPALWRRQSGQWAPFEASGATDREDGTFFKVHGTSATDAWIVGTNGVALHFDGGVWTEIPTDAEAATATAPLLTVNVGGERPLAVGGAGNGLILEYDGSAWLDRTPEFQPGYNGVCARGGAAWAVGVFGVRSRRIDGRWESDTDRELVRSIDDDWHACVVTPGGDVWMVGGRISARPLTDGVVGYLGSDPMPAVQLD